MLFKGSKKSAIYYLLLLFSFSSQAEKETLVLHPNNEKLAFLRAKPQKCVVLDEGRQCFAHITFTLSTTASKDVCLIQKSPYKVIYCLNESKQIQKPKHDFIYEFISSKTTDYQLISRDKKVLAETTIEVNWVYESSPRKRRWRAF